MKQRRSWGVAGVLVALVGVLGACQGSGQSVEEPLDPQLVPPAPGIEMRPSLLMGLRPMRPSESEPVQPLVAEDPTSRFDQWLLGDESAISEAENLGYQLFKRVGCVVCHDGQAVGAPEGDAEVASLRELGDGPFLSDGSQPTLASTVRFMASEQLDAELSDREIRLIVEFLGTLRD